MGLKAARGAWILGCERKLAHSKIVFNFPNYLLANMGLSRKEIIDSANTSRNS